MKTVLEVLAAVAFIAVLYIIIMIVGLGKGDRID
jgi:hypothetical protein